MKLVLLDRDGVINEERPDYVKSVGELAIFPHALEALALFRQNGFTCVITTNQSVVGRGILEQSALDRIHAYLSDTVRSHGGEIAEVIVCTDAPDRATYRRKPSPGMLIEALEKYQASADKTPFIGDTLTDMQAAYAANCPRYLVKSDKRNDAMQPAPLHLQPVTICADILDAARRIVTMH